MPSLNAVQPMTKRGELGIDETDQHLTFGLGNETYAIPIPRIREILQFETLTEVPLTPAFVRGVLDMRGAVVPVVDLAVRFERERTVIGPRTCVVILEVPASGASVILGVVVDRVNEVLEIPPEQLEAAPSFGGSTPPDLVRGIAKVGSRFVIVLDVARAFSADELVGLCGREPVVAEG